jgi:hypothetical protein
MERAAAPADGQRVQADVALSGSPHDPGLSERSPSRGNGSCVPVGSRIVGGVLVGAEGLPILACGSIMPRNKPRGEAVMGDAQRLSETEQLEILALLEAVNTEHSAMRAARALAELMRHLHALGQRIASELPDQDRDFKPVRR